MPHSCFIQVLRLKYLISLTSRMRETKNTWLGVFCTLFCLFEDLLFVCFFLVLRPTREFFTQMGTSPLPVKGLQILTYIWQPLPLSNKGSLACHSSMTRGIRLQWSLPGPVTLTPVAKRLAEKLTFHAVGWMFEFYLYIKSSREIILRKIICDLH